MPRRKLGCYYPTPEDTRFLTVEQIAEQVGLEPAVVRTMIATNWRILSPQVRRRKGRVYYNAGLLDLIKAMLGQSHRSLQSPEDDWLARYQREQRATTQVK